MVMIPKALNNIGPRLWNRFLQSSERVASRQAADAAQDFFTPVASSISQQVKQALHTRGIAKHLDDATPIFQSNVTQATGILSKNDAAAMTSRMLSTMLKHGKSAEIRVLNFSDAAAAKAFMDSRAAKRYTINGQSAEKLIGSRNGVFSSVSYTPLGNNQIVQVFEMGTGPKFSAFKGAIGRGVTTIKQAIGDIAKTFMDTFGTLLGGLKQTVSNTAKTARGQTPL